MTSAFKLTIDPEGIARVVFDLPNEKVNKISADVLDELNALIEGIKDNTGIKALVFSSAKDGIFIVGADIKSFRFAFGDPEVGGQMIKKGHAVLDNLQDLPFPTIALVNGICLGGGLELSLAFDYRIVTDHFKTQLGVPEVNLGIFPGWGGTQRLPRLVGLTEGLKMILSGKPVKAKKAFKIKLADAIVPFEFMDEKVNEFVKLILTPEGKSKVLKKRKRTGMMNFLLEKNPLGRALIYYMSKKNVLKQTKGHYPAPIAALELIKRSYTLSLKKGLKKEIETFIDSFKNAFRHAPNLLQVFFNSELVKKDPGGPEGAVGRVVHSAGVLGAGTMGSGISWLFSYRDIPVRMKDINWEAVGKGIGYAWSTYKTLMKIRKLTPNQANLKFHHLSGAVDYSGFQNLDIVIEAATENLELKHKIFQELEKEIRPDCIIGTNTSSLTIEQLAPALKHPERLVGMHFFNPPSRMPLVEIVQGKKTSPEAVATAVDICKRLKKTPIVVGDCTGFLVNRVFVMGMNEVMLMLEQGVEMAKLEKTILSFGMPMAPFVLADEVGIDVNYKISPIFKAAYGERIVIPTILEQMNEHGFLGKKVGKGFYIYENKKRKPNPEVQKLLPTLNPHGLKISKEGIIERVILAMINEATRCLEEKVVKSAQHLDMALILGTGFPPFRGGLLRYADAIGLNNVVEKLKRLEQSQGPRYTPSDYLQEMARANNRFYE